MSGDIIDMDILCEFMFNGMMYGYVRPYLYGMYPEYFKRRYEVNSEWVQISSEEYIKGRLFVMIHELTTARKNNDVASIRLYDKEVRCTTHDLIKLGISADDVKSYIASVVTPKNEGVYVII